MQEVNVVDPLTNEITTQLSNTKELVFGVDSSGKYMGLVDRGTEYIYVYAPPPADNLIWNFELNQWQQVANIEEIRQQALQDIDNLAGFTRTKYITSVPGQEAVYAQKLLEAEEFIKTGAIGEYLKAEASAVNKDVTTVAQSIIDKSILWNTKIGPQIEGIRRKNKLLVQEADSVEKIYEIKALNIQELSAI